MTSLDTREVRLSGGQHIEMSPFGALVVYPPTPDMEELQQRIKAERQALQSADHVEFIGETILTREKLHEDLKARLRDQIQKNQYGARSKKGLEGLETKDYAAIPALEHWIKSPLLASSEAELG